MNRFEARSPFALDLTLAGSIAAVLVADLISPLGVAVWVFYLVPLVLCLLSRSTALPIVVAAAGSVAIGLGFVLSRRGADNLIWLGAINRPLAVSVIWGAAAIVRRTMVARLALQREQWLQAAQGELAEAVRGELGPAVIGERALGVLAEHTGAVVGVLYALRGDALERLATRAFSPDDDRGRVVRAGEGLVGQAALDGKVAVLSDLPPDYLKVSSALGDTRPRHVVVSPVSAEGRVNGVIELGFLDPSGTSERELLRRVAEPLGMALRSAVYREQLELILEEKQRQADELAAQQEETRATNEDLEQHGRSLREANDRLKEQTAALEAQRRELLATQAALTANADALAQASRFKSEFLANMSHELRTPLNSAIILARLLADNDGGNLTEEQVRYAEIIHGAGQDLLALIDDVLDMSKIEAGKVDVHAERVPITGVVGPLGRTFGPVAGQRRLAFRVEIAKDAPEELTTDPRRLLQILNNLLSNAFKFTEEGEVALLVRAEPGGRVGFVVEDSGIGIPEERQAIIFEAFRQADGTTARKYGGTGLGLSISRELARLLGGDVTVESAAGRGSKFTLSIPAVLDAERRSDRWLLLGPPERRAPKPIRAASPEPPTSGGPGPPPTLPDAVATFADDRGSLVSGGPGPPPTLAREGRLILVMEDDPAFAGVLHDLARELSFDVIVARGAEEGLELARRHAPDAVLLDVELPDGSGLVVLERLKRDPATRHIPVHVISGGEHERPALEAGAVGYAQKPVDREQLIEAIRKLEERIARRMRRLLLVEGDARLRASVASLLAADGVEIVAVGTVREALVELAGSAFDCVVLDLALPDASGYELIEEMARSERRALPPVIVHTGREISRDEEARLRRDATSIVIKGARSPERLLDEVTLFLHEVEANLPAEQRRLLERARTRDSGFEGRRVLVVEDDVRTIFAISKLLESRGAKLEIARNGREALDVIDRVRDLDLVLMDVMMPEMDGLAATREIRRRVDRARLPIIALTAKAMSDDRERCLAAGASDYVAKPIDVEELLSLCRVWMRR